MADEIALSNETPQTYTVIRETWLTRKPTLKGLVYAAAFSLILAVVSYLSEKNFFIFPQDMAATKESVFQNHQYWQAWSSLFVHADAKHLLSNLFLFFIFAAFLIEYFGLFVFPLAGFFFGGLVNLVALSQMPAETKLIGASGVVFWMGAVWLTLYFLIDVRRSLPQRLLRSVGVGLVLFMPAEAFDPSISYQSHGFGFLFGVLFGVVYYFLFKDKFKAALVQKEIPFDEVAT